jgi:pSer/pThr/pTyr-binding forkhead associated (FHA) protein
MADVCQIQRGALTWNSPALSLHTTAWYRYIEGRVAARKLKEKVVMSMYRILSRQGVEIRRFSTDSLPVGAVLTVGRSQSCTIALGHEATRSVSREHFQLEHRHLGWVLLNRSSHGTFKGDQSVDQVTPKPGDVFHFGQCVLCVGTEAVPSGYQLHWQDDKAACEDFALLWPGRNTVGHLPTNTIMIADDSVSRHHARITVNGSEIVIEDLNSFVGTFLAEKQITVATKLGPSARLRLGGVHAWLKVVPVAAPVQTRAVSVRPPVTDKWITATVWTAIMIILAIVLIVFLR